jgi:hypothetical protein
MILVDNDYDPAKGFTVDAVVYQKDLKDGEAAVSGINGKSAIIAIDKHGNESKGVRIQKEEGKRPNGK